ncbi:MAG: DUF2079 domain-containing protein [Polyangiales bacterium]
MSEPVRADDPRFPLVRISNVALVAALAFAFLALRRYATFHNETFDLAFYARLVWGLGRWDRYQPLTNSDLWGLHASPILYPLGWLGRVLPIIPLMLVVQAASVCAAGIPLARIAARRVGHPAAADVTLVAYLLYPTIGTLATYEFHPSALALFPLALAIDWFDRRQLRQATIALFIAALCREDVALVAGFVGLAVALRSGAPSTHRRAGIAIFAAGCTWFAVYFFVIAPRHLPAHGSLDLHFGHIARSPAALLAAIVRHPIATLRTLVTPLKLLYAPRMLAPLAFLSLLAPRWLLPALVPFGINVLSQFPTAPEIASHYSALAVPFLFASAAHGAGRLAAQQPGALNRNVVLSGIAVAAGTLLMQHRAGATPLSRRWDASVFRRDARAVDLANILRAIPRSDSVVAADYVLPHVAERSLIQRLAAWDRRLDWVIVPAEHRAHFGATQDLWRSTEEITVRNTLADPRYGLYAVAGAQLLFRRAWPARTFARTRYVEFEPEPDLHPQHIDAGAHLFIAGWGLRAQGNGSVLTLLLAPREPLPFDMGLEAGFGAMHPNGDRQDPEHIVSVLPFDGLFSPIHVRVGEVARTRIELAAPPDTVLREGLYVGTRRIDGSRVDPDGPHWIRLQ